MYQQQRLEQIMELLQTKEVITTDNLMNKFGVSQDTVRRDFSILTEQGKVQRIHGGIMRLDKNEQMYSFNSRLNRFDQAKTHIAEIAKKILVPGKTYFFDVSTTVLKLSQITDQQLTVYTHSLDNSIMLSDDPKVDLHTLGGKFSRKNRYFYSLQESSLLDNISFDIAFFGAAGLKNGTVSYEDQEDTYVKKLAMKHAKKKVLLAETEKFSKQATYKLADLSDFDLLITDKKPHKQNLERIETTY